MFQPKSKKKASHVLPPRSDLACYTVGSRQGVSGGWMDEWLFSPRNFGEMIQFESIFDYFAGN